MEIVNFRFLRYDEPAPKDNKAKMHAIVMYESGFGPFRKHISKRVHSFYEIHNGIKTFSGVWYDSKTGEKCSPAVALAYRDWAREKVKNNC